MAESNKNETAEEIEIRLTSTDPLIIDSCLNYAKDLLTSEQSRSEAVARKATTIMGFAGAIAALSVEMVNILPLVQARYSCVVILLCVIYACMLGAISTAVWFAFGGRKRPIRSVPKIEDVFVFQPLKEIELKKKWLSNVISSYNRDRIAVNRMVTNNYTALQALAVAIGLLMAFLSISVLALIL